MAAEQAQPSDLDHAQRRLAGLEADLLATLEEAYRLSANGDHDAAILALDAQSGVLDDAMDALARDVSGLRLAPPPARTSRTLLRFLAAAVVTVIAIASVVVLGTRDPLSGLATRIEHAEATTDPQARLALIEDVYAALQRAPARVVAQSSVPRNLADAARRTADDLEDDEAPREMQMRAAVIAADLDQPDGPTQGSPIAPAGNGSPTDPIVRSLPRG